MGLFYSKKDCLKTNKWVKKQCLKNGENLSIGDLLIVNNNVSIPNESGFLNTKTNCKWYVFYCTFR